MSPPLPAPWWLPAGGPDEPERVGEADPPIEGLWVRGADPYAFDRRVAIIGARDASAYGLEVAEGLAADLAARGVCIVSGMARGCDAAAHRGALAVGGPTIAVLAGGVDVPYPAGNARLYERIVREGSVVSERPLGTRAIRPDFLARNRIIAALADGLVIVQARTDKSGVLSTVGFAGSLGVTTFAVPGDVRSALSSLPHQLLREGAGLCATADDVLRELGGGGPEPARASLPASLTPEERAVVGALDDGPGPAGLLAARAELPLPVVLRALTALERAGVAVRSGAAYVRR